MDEGSRWLHAQLTPPPDGLQARARGEVTVIASDGGITVEVTARQLDLPEGTEVVLRSGDAEICRLMIAGGSGSHGETLDADDEHTLKDGAEVQLHLAEEETAAGETALMHGVLRRGNPES